MAKKVVEKRNLIITVEVTASEGSSTSYFEKLAKQFKRESPVCSDVFDADPNDSVKNPGSGVLSAKLVSVKVS